MTPATDSASVTEALDEELLSKQPDELTEAELRQVGREMGLVHPDDVEIAADGTAEITAAAGTAAKLDRYGTGVAPSFTNGIKFSAAESTAELLGIYEDAADDLDEYGTGVSDDSGDSHPTPTRASSRAYKGRERPDNTDS